MNLSLTGPTLVWAFFIAFAYSSWPILGKYSQAGGIWVNTWVLIGSTIAGLALAAPGMTKTPLPSSKAVAMVLIAGLINGAAVYYYSIKTADPNIPTGRFLMTVIMMMVILSALLSWALNGETLSMRQWIGLGMAIVAIVLLAH